MLELSDELERRLRLGNLTEDEYAEFCELRTRADGYAKKVEALADCEALLKKIAKLESDISANTEVDLYLICRSTQAYMKTLISKIPNRMAYMHL